MKKLFLFVLCTIASGYIFSHGCKDGNKLLPSKITDHHSFELSFIYDDNNRLVKTIEIEASNDETVYIYDDAGMLREKQSVSDIDGQHITKYSYSVKKDSIFISNFAQNSTSEISRIDTLIIDSNGCLQKEVKSSEFSSGYLDYSYNSNKTLAKIYSYSKGNDNDYESIQTIAYVYDKHKSLFCDVNIARWFFTYEFRHFSQIVCPTIISYTGKMIDLSTNSQVSGSSQTEVIKYTYNEKGYPLTKETTTFDNANESNESYTLFIEYIKAK